MDYKFIIGEDLTDCDKKSTWNLLHAYIDALSQILIDEYPRYGIHAISILKYQCVNMVFLTKADIIDCFREWFSKEGSQKSIISKYFRMLRLWKFQ